MNNNFRKKISKNRKIIYKILQCVIPIILCISILFSFSSCLFLAKGMKNAGRNIARKRDFAVLKEVDNLVHDKYYDVDKLNQAKEMMDINAARGLLATLDPYSYIYPKNIFHAPGSSLQMGVDLFINKYHEYFIKDFTENDNGKKLNENAKYIGGRILKSEQMIKRGDQILSIEGNRVYGLTSRDFMDLMESLAEQPTIEMVVYRETLQAALKFQVTKRKITPVSTKSLVFSDNTLFLKFDSFTARNKENGVSESTAFQMKGHYKNYKSKYGVPNKIILDLRDNHGGDLTDFGMMSSWFIESKERKKLPIIALKGREEPGSYNINSFVIKDKDDKNGQNNEKDLLEKSLWEENKDLKLVVLVSKETASAAEALLGVITAYAPKGKVRILSADEKTFGKGVAQAYGDLKSNSNYVYAITIAEYFSPMSDGRWRRVNNIGFKADEIIEDTTISSNIENDAICKSALQFLNS